VLSKYWLCGILFLILALFLIYHYKTATLPLSLKNKGDVSVLDNIISSDYQSGDTKINNIISTNVNSASSVNNTETSSVATTNINLDANLTQPVVTPGASDIEILTALVDEEKFSEALNIAKGLVKSPNAEIRTEVVDALGWIGIKALPELSVMLSDSDSDIADSAYNFWEEIVKEISDDVSKADIVVAGVNMLSDQGNAESAVMMLDRIPEDMAVTALLKLINSDNIIAKETAIDHYEFVTGEEFTDQETAERWIEKAKAE